MTCARMLHGQRCFASGWILIRREHCIRSVCLVIIRRHSNKHRPLQQKWSSDHAIQRITQKRLNRLYIPNVGLLQSAFRESKVLCIIDKLWKIKIRALADLIKKYFVRLAGREWTLHNNSTEVRMQKAIQDKYTVQPSPSSPSSCFSTRLLRCRGVHWEWEFPFPIFLMGMEMDNV